jgi:hypothetical protein
VKQEIPCEQCAEVARGAGAVSTRRASEGRGGRWSGGPVPKRKDGKGRRERGRESSEGRAGFIALCRLKRAEPAPNPIEGAKPEGAVRRYGLT